MKHLLFILLIFSFSILKLLAQSGGPPMITDDPGTPDKGAWEINLSLNSEIQKYDKEFEAPLLDINFGLNERIQLKLEFP